MIASAEEFVSLRMSDDPERYRRAAHEAAAPGVWEDVVRRFPEMRFWVVINKTVPLEILRELSQDGDSRVRIAVAMKRKTPEDILTALARDQDEGVRLSVARNPKTPVYILRDMLGDEWPEVVDEVRRRLADQ